MFEKPSPTLRLRIDREALGNNWRALDRLSGEAQAGAAVKADCYGLGVNNCVPTLRDAGANEFFVAHWSEVEDVARHMPSSRIAVLHGILNAEETQYARASGAVPVIDSVYQAKVWQDAGGGRCHLMVDTGINRLGIAMDEIGDPLIAGLEVDCLMSHLACADENVPMNAQQLLRFREAIGAVPHRRASLANSAGIGLGREYQFDMTRPGLSLYGGVPRPELMQHIGQVAYPEAAIIQVRHLNASDTVGYNATFTAERPMRVGVISLGYADGFLCSWAGSFLQHDGRKLQMLGKVSMDMVIVDLSEADNLTEGDWISVPYLLPDAAQQSSLSQYELLTVLGTRFSTVLQ